MDFFNVLDGPCYTTLVKDLWVRAEIVQAVEGVHATEIHSSVMGLR